MQIVVASCLIGGRDAPRPVTCSTKVDTQFVLFTDQRSDDSQGWQQRPVWPIASTPVLTCRWHKYNLLQLFPQADHVIWQDSSVELLMPPELIVAHANGAAVASLRHIERDCVYDEAEVCRKDYRDADAVLSQHVAQLRAEGYPEHAGLHETPLLVYNRAATEFCSEVLFRMWRGSHRDQLSFDPALRAVGLSCFDLPGTRNDNPFMRMHEHPYVLYPQCFRHHCDVPPDYVGEYGAAVLRQNDWTEYRNRIRLLWSLDS